MDRCGADTLTGAPVHALKGEVDLASVDASPPETMPGHPGLEHMLQGLRR